MYKQICVELAVNVGHLMVFALGGETISCNVQAVGDRLNSITLLSTKDGDVAKE